MGSSTLAICRRIETGQDLRVHVGGGVLAENAVDVTVVLDDEPLVEVLAVGLLQQRERLPVGPLPDQAAFQQQVRDYLQPGTSALFMVIEQVTPDKTIAALQEYGGTVIRTSLSEEDTRELQAALTPPAQAGVEA